MTERTETPRAPAKGHLGAAHEPVHDGLLSSHWPGLESLLNRGEMPPPHYDISEIRRLSETVTVRDGTRLATDVYLPPDLPAPTIVARTPFGREMAASGFADTLLAIARRGFAVVSQDCRGTGDSEPDTWDYLVFEPEDGVDFVEWVTRQQWCDGFIGSFGGSYLGLTQWQMATHPAIATIAPSNSALGAISCTANLHMFVNAYAHVIGKGDDKVPMPITEMERAFEHETMTTGCFNEPLHLPVTEELVSQFPKVLEMSPTAAKRWLWEKYCDMTCSQRADFVKSARGSKNITMVDLEAMTAVFGHRVPHAALGLPRPSVAHVCKDLKAPPLMRTGWYDWHVYDALASWEALRRHAPCDVAARAKLIITPWAHNMPGYLEGAADNPLLLREDTALTNQVGVLLRWYNAVRTERTDEWPTVTYFLMGANEWRTAPDWPVPGTRQRALYLGEGGTLAADAPSNHSEPDCYTYDPQDPTPTVGGSIVSYVYTPGGVDVGDVQRRRDVLTYSTAPLDNDLDVVGPLRMVLYASSSACDTDWVVRLSDVFPDGRSLQVQSGLLRARYRDDEPQLLDPGRVYEFEIDMWATATRFKPGHRLRIDISSADFPHYDRNSNLGGGSGDPVPAHQKVFHDREHPSHLLFSTLAPKP